MTDPEGRFKEINRPVKELMGYPVKLVATDVRDPGDREIPLHNCLYFDDQARVVVDVTLAAKCLDEAALTQPLLARLERLEARVQAVEDA